LAGSAGFVGAAVGAGAEQAAASTPAIARPETAKNDLRFTPALPRTYDDPDL
jgi:hypothetical protein